MSYYTEPDDYCDDERDGFPYCAAGADAPAWHDDRSHVPMYLRMGACNHCGDVFQLPELMIRGVRGCKCGRVRVYAAGLSAMHGDGYLRRNPTYTASGGCRCAICKP